MADQINTEVNEAEIINLWHRYRPIDDAPEAVAFARALLSASQPVAGQAEAPDLVDLVHKLHYAAYSWGFEAGKVGDHVDTTTAGNKANAARDKLLGALSQPSAGTAGVADLPFDREYVWGYLSEVLRAKVGETKDPHVRALMDWLLPDASSPCTEGQRGSGQQEGGGDGR